MLVEGRVWKLGDSISTDDIVPGRYFHLRSNLLELAKHTLEDVREDFAGNVEEGDIVVAGKNFGLGSSREHAVRVFKILGVSCIVARSFARIFFRNAINVGLPVVELNDVDRIKENDFIRVDLEGGVLENITTGETFQFGKLPPFVLRIVTVGGIEEVVRRYGDIEP